MLKDPFGKGSFVSSVVVFYVCVCLCSVVEMTLRLAALAVQLTVEAL